MPIDRGLIDQQLQALGEGSGWWDVRELRDLPAVLHADERILAIARGKVARVRVVRRSWLILVTDRRLLCIRSGSGTAWRQVEVPAAQIAQVTLRVGPFKGRVVIEAGGRKYRLLVSRLEAHKLLSALSALNAPGDRIVGGSGPTRVVRQVIDHIMALPAAALDSEPRPKLPPGPGGQARLAERVEMLEGQVQELQQQVDFLEQLLKERHETAGVGRPR